MRMLNEFRALNQASRQAGRSILAIVAEVVRLRLSPGRLGVAEYLDFRLHEDDLSLDEKLEFAGWRAQAILDEILVDDYSRFLSLDKISMYAILASYRLPVPLLRAVFNTQRPSSLRSLHSVEEVARFLQEPDNVPVYVKPSMGAFGRGNALITRAERGSIVLGNGSAVEIEGFCRSLGDARGLGWLFQEPLTSHPSIAEVCGEKISSIRMHTFLAPNGPVITKATLKINVGNVDWDNFQHGETGNMLGAVDVDTGVVTRVIRGTGSAQAVNPPHPKTGREIVGFRLPYWRETKALLMEASLAFPGFICPGWDVAICEKGPIILEVNFFGDLDLSQHASRRGFIDGKFMKLMSDRRLDHLLTTRIAANTRSPENGRTGVRKRHWRW